MRRIQVVVNGRSLEEIGPWEAVKYSHGWPYGPLRASWKMDPVRHASLFSGASVVLMLNGVSVWRGFLNEPGRDGDMTALGLWEQGKSAQCLTSLGATTAEPRDAVVQAINRGRIRWSLPVPDVYTGGVAQQMDAPYPAQSVAALLDRVTDEQGTRWYIDSFTGALMTAADPTTPSWVVPAQVAGYGLTPADDSVATHLVLEYLTGPGQRAVVTVVSPDYITGSPSIEQRVDLVSKGFINSTQATAYGTAMFGKSVGKVGWADSLLLGRGDVLTIGGTVLDPALVFAGTMGRLDGVWDDRVANPAADTNIVAAETEFDEDDDTVLVKPLGLERRTIGDVMTWIAA